MEVNYVEINIIKLRLKSTDTRTVFQKKTYFFLAVDARALMPMFHSLNSHLKLKISCYSNTVN